jgi:hypothetical protein
MRRGVAFWNYDELTVVRRTMRSTTAISSALSLITLAALVSASFADPSADAGVLVDPGVRWIQTCATEVLSFRS